MTDPYVIPGTYVLKNKLGITDLHSLLFAESEHFAIFFKVLRVAPVEGNYDVQHFKRFHGILFRALYDWAGEFRLGNLYKPEEVLGGKTSIEYSDFNNIEGDLKSCLDSLTAVKWESLSPDSQAKELAAGMAKIWKVHPFRDGNTRTTVLFSLQFAESRGMRFRSMPFLDGGRFFRAALVAASAYYKDPLIGDRSKPEYLVNFVRSAMLDPLVSIKSRMDNARAEANKAEVDKSKIERRER